MFHFTGYWLFQTLKKHVLALQALADKLPAGSVQEVQEDLAVAIKGIVTPPAPPKKQEKPELVVDDVDDY